MTIIHFYSLIVCVCVVEPRDVQRDDSKSEPLQVLFFPGTVRIMDPELGSDVHHCWVDKASTELHAFFLDSNIMTVLTL